MSTKKVALYARVSTSNTHQNPETQLLDLRKFSSDREFQVFNEYVDHGISGSKESRPGLDKLMADAKKKRFDIVLVWRFDCFARSVKHLVDALHAFRYLGIAFISYQENIDTGSPLGEAMFTIVSAMAQLERDIIRERVKAGLRRAKEKGIRLGRPELQVDMVKVQKMKDSGISIRKISEELGVSRTTITRILNQKRVAFKPFESKVKPIE